MSLKSWEIREEQVRADAIANTYREAAINCIKSGKFPFEVIAEACNMTLQQVNELAASIQP